MTQINRVEIIDFEYEVRNLAAATEHTHTARERARDT